MWRVYEIIHIRTEVIDESEEWSSTKFSHLSNWKEKAWNNQGLNGFRTCDLREYRCGALPTVNKLTSVIMCGFVAQLLEHRTGIRGGHGFESHWSPEFFWLLFFQLLKLKIYCDVHSSLSRLILLIFILLTDLCKMEHHWSSVHCRIPAS